MHGLLILRLALYYSPMCLLLVNMTTFRVHYPFHSRACQRACSFSPSTTGSSYHPCHSLLNPQGHHPTAFFTMQSFDTPCLHATNHYSTITLSSDFCVRPRLHPNKAYNLKAFSRQPLLPVNTDSEEPWSRRAFLALSNQSLLDVLSNHTFLIPHYRSLMDASLGRALVMAHSFPSCGTQLSFFILAHTYFQARSWNAT